MSNVICIAYQPGAYGSFLAWAIEKTSASRAQYLPAIMDDPLLPDGSSHAYASFCKVKDNSEFIEGIYAARKEPVEWGYHIHAGWPVEDGEDIEKSIRMVLANLSTFDQMFMVECTDELDHCVRYLRNEATMATDRWYGMLNIKNGDQLFSRLKRDVSQKQLSDGFSHPKLCRINMKEFSGPADLLYDKITSHMRWPARDKEFFISVKDCMWKMQSRFYDRLAELTTDEPRTPAELAVYRLIKGE